MATTTNFGWETPDDTDLVKDGAAAIRTVANSIDTSFVDLKGGTTGQILSKASNTDLDYTWIANDTGDITGVTAGTGLTGGGTSGSVTLALDSAAVIAPTIVDAKGDIIAATAADTVSRLAVGSNDQVLTADSTTATGLKWATPSAGGTTWTSFTPTLTQSGTVTATASNCVYTTVGKVVIGSGRLVVTGSGTSNNPIEITLPLTQDTSYGNAVIGVATIYDASAVLYYPSIMRIFSNKIRLRGTNVTANAYQGQTSAGFTAGLATDDEIDFQFVYRSS